MSGRECVQCHVQFEPNPMGRKAKYCSDKCRANAWNRAHAPQRATQHKPRRFNLGKYPRNITHGNLYGYNQGCRCEACVTAARDIWRLKSAAGYTLKPRRNPPICTFDGCTRRTAAKKLCTGHYAQVRLGKPMTPLAAPGGWGGYRKPVRSPDDHRTKRQAREAVAPGLSAHYRRLLLKVWLRQHRRCTYCDDIATTMDHVLPLVRGGTNHEGNLTPCCKPCNSSKGGWTVVEWRSGLRLPQMSASLASHIAA